MTPTQKDAPEEWGGLEDHHVGVPVPAEDAEPDEQDPDVLIAMRELARARKINRRRESEK